MTVDEFIQKYNGKGIDFDLFYGFQCMDLAEQYNQDVVGAPKLGGNAIDVWTGYPTAFYDKIANSPTGVPQKGDIVIWGLGVGQFGHIAVFQGGDTNKFTSFDQNFPLGTTCHLQLHNYTGVLGWLHPKKTAEPMTNITQKELDQIIILRDTRYNLIKTLCDIYKVEYTDDLPQLLERFTRFITDLRGQLASCMSKPPVIKETIKEVPVEKLVYVEKIVDQTNFKKLSFIKKFNLLFS